MAHRVLATLLVFAAALSASAATIDNDDSCDIALLPAATLLLPYFDVDLWYPTGESTVFSVTNVTNVDQIAHVTLWTNYAYPVFGFDIYLTGYDVQAIDLYDVLERGIVAPDAGTGTETYWSERQKYSDVNRDLDLSHCGRLPGPLDDAILQRLQSALLEGNVAECSSVGTDNVHNAIGYATIDVVGSCGSAGVTDESYWTKDLRYDNVLTGEYTQVNGQENRAQAEPLVHIRAIPEGGKPVTRRVDPERYDAGFERTFYGRFQPADAPRLDGRQPLPSQFAARWIQGGNGAFETNLKIWREGRGLGTCADIAMNADLTINNVVVFDEDENVIGSAGASTLPATSLTSITDAGVFPPLPPEARSGWVYLDLDGRTSQLARPRQAWVISSMRAENRYATDTTAIAMGNGCSTRVRNAEIGPAPNVSPRHGVAATNNDDSCDVGLYPAATLLLPYFEVDLEDRREATLLSITNVSNRERIARVTLWTDYAFPVLSFNVALGGYDVQSINLYDVLAAGNLPQNGGACAAQVRQLPGDVIERMQLAFTEGIVPGLGELRPCNNVGNEHEYAVGYATIDLVRNCDDNLPSSPEYWTTDLAYDNVLIGDVQHVAAANAYAHGSPLVHIRAVPEGGIGEPPFRHTFYSRFQPASTPKRDGRQPLPARFAARWRNGGYPYSLETFLNIWREPVRAVDATCPTYDDNVAQYADIVVFDDAENAVSGCRYCMIFEPPSLPATSRVSVTDYDYFPQLTNGAVAGWIYLNLDDDDVARHVPSNNWVVVTAYDEGRFGVAVDATALGNGCSAPGYESEISYGTAVIGPSENVNP